MFTKVQNAFNYVLDISDEVEPLAVIPAINTI